MKRATLLILGALGAFLPAFGEGEIKGRFAEKNVYLDGGVGNRPAVEHIYEMVGESRELVLHLSFRKGLYRLSKTGDGKGTFGGLVIEMNDATKATDPVANPFRPVALQKGVNADWVDFVANDFPYPNPEPGYWYTWGRTMEELKRPVRIALGARGRYRVRLRGVVDDRRDTNRVPTLVGVTEVDPAAPGEVLIEPEAAQPVVARTQLLFPTGDRKTSLIAVDREAPVSVRPGEKFTYFIRVTNLTKRPVGTISIAEEGAGRIELVRSTPAFDRDGEEGVVWRLGVIEPEETREIAVEAVAEDRSGVQRSCWVRWESGLVTQKVSVVR